VATPPAPPVAAPQPIAAPAPPLVDDGDEIDLTGALNALSRTGVSIPEALEEATSIPSARATAGPGAGAPVESAAPATVVADDEVELEAVFEDLRNEAVDDMVELPPPEQSERLLSMAETYQAAGMYEEARAALETVANDSRFRFRAAAALGQLAWQQGQADTALRWLELANEAPAPSPEAGRAVMYELAERLEQTGDTTRALSVFLELLAEQDDYRDVRGRVERLGRVQADH
jgi:tetratricopeptide (TPR) repeat protein